ncbi:MAG: PepSY domain-containing protein [Bacteroidota bacterium]
MTISLWRISHLWLAIVSGLFLLIASITGAILSFEPVYEGSFDYKVKDAENLTLAELVQSLARNHLEISSVKKDPNGFIQVNIFGDQGEETFYINPFNGEKLGSPIEIPALFDFCRMLHRSLFFGKIGRFLVGLTAIILLFISVTGFVLVLKKQGGLRSYLKKVIKDEFYRDYHTKLGKIFLIVMIVIGLTGGYLFLERFSVIPKSIAKHTIDFEDLKEEPLLAKADFPIFQTSNVGELNELVFPFSEFVDDFFELKLENRELLINQLTGEVVSEIEYSITQKLSVLSFNLHTAEGQPWWAILLGLTSLSTLFFMFSGFKIYLKRAAEKTKVANPHQKEESTIIIAYGSEMGTTLLFAQALHESLLDAGKKSYLLEMNAFVHFPMMQHLIIVTSTYGAGGPPANAGQFIEKFNETKKNRPFLYAVVGFGSTKYPDFCQFAIDVNCALKSNHQAEELIPLTTINNRSVKDFDEWVQLFQDQIEVQLSVKTKVPEIEWVNLKVIKKEFSKNNEDATFLLELAAKNGHLKSMQSGDLLVYRAEEDRMDRQYSMSVAKDKRSVLLSVKKHPNGLVSGYLSTLEKNALLRVSFHENASFHFPEYAHHVLMIANGTGIAPFLGMIENNQKKIPISLFWGGQNETSFDLYRSQLYQFTKDGRLSQIQTAFSRIKQNPSYVQDLIKEKEELITQILAKDSVIMICGSLKMQQGVEAVLDEVTRRCLNKPLDDFKATGTIKADCY